MEKELQANKMDYDVWTMPEDKATLILRWFLPRDTYCTPEVTAERLEELVTVCKSAGIAAVQFLVGWGPDWVFMPCTPEYAKRWAEELKTVAARLRSEGISYQLNVVCVMGHHAGGEDFHDMFDWERMVDDAGNEAYGTGCPLGERFRETAGRSLRAFASTRPDVIWIDDDVRYHNHDHLNGGADWFCFCENHLKRFAKAYGRYLTREELLEKILAPGKPSPERLLWRQVQADTMNEFCEWMAREVHAVSPHTRMAKMTSGPEVHSAEGMEWKGLFTALSDGLRPLGRPTFGPYVEGNPQDYVESLLMADRMRADLEGVLGEGNIDLCPEIEFAAYTTWVRSGGTFGYQLETSQYLGMRGTTMDIYDWEGAPLSEEPMCERVMKKMHPRLNAIAALELNKARRCGVALLTGEDICAHVQLSEGENTIGSMMNSRTWDRTLSLMGTPCVYTTSKTAEGHAVIALDGLTAWYPDDDELKVLLAKGVLLDANACDVLLKRGFGQYIGVESIAFVPGVQTGSEFFHGGIIEGMDERRMNQRLHELHMSQSWGRMKISRGAKVLTEVNDPRGRKYPGTVLYENELGGRVAVYTGRDDLTRYFRCHARVDWINALTRWLSKGSFVIELKPAHPVSCIIRECEKGLLVACANFGTDPLIELSGVIRPGFVPSDIKILGDEVFRRPCGGELKIECSEAGEIVFSVTPEVGINTYGYITLLLER